MNNYNLLLNGSGIKDPTAYAAIKNCKREGNDMNELRPNPGEIWEVEIGSQYKDMLVLSVYDRGFCNMIQLHDENKNLGRNVEVICTDGIKYADCEKLSFKYFEGFREYKKTVPDYVLEKIKVAVAEATDLTTVTYRTDTTAREFEAETDKYKREQPEDVKPEDYSEMLTRAIKAETERDVYKILYMDAIRGKLS